MYKSGIMIKFKINNIVSSLCIYLIGNEYSSYGTGSIDFVSC